MPALSAVSALTWILSVCLGFVVVGFGFRGLRFGFWILGFGFWVSGFGFCFFFGSGFRVLEEFGQTPTGSVTIGLLTCLHIGLHLGLRLYLKFSEMLSLF